VKPELFDHRGRPFELCGAAKLPADAPPAVRLGLARVLGTPSISLLPTVRIIAVAIVITLVLKVVAVLSPGAVSSSLYQGTFFLTSIAVAFFVLRAIVYVRALVLAGFGDRESMAFEMMQRLLRHNICPSCGYALRGLQIDKDGMFVCPECGAAWRLET